MESEPNVAYNSKGMKIAGWIITILPCLMLLFSAAMKFLKPEPGFSEGIKHIGWENVSMTALGVVELACTVIYLIPRTAVLGAILLAAYLGGAVATHVRVGDPFWAPILVGVFVWLGLWLRDPRLRALTPLTS
jgi:hypothetical protein